jgi:hypothetical protein
MIPKDQITKQNILDAIAEIDRDGVPIMRNAKGFDLVYNGKTYPPKYVLSLATKYAIGRELQADEFIGGEPTNIALRTLGFEITRRVQQSIRDGFEKVMERYVTARNGEPFGSQHELWKVFAGLRENIGNLDPIQQSPHVKVEASLGQGNWTKVPWIAFMDDRETKSTQKGIYGVFLFRQDMTGLYLTLAQGVTDPRKRLGARVARQSLKSVANEIRPYIGDLEAAGFKLDDKIQLKVDGQLGSDYEDSVVAYKLYEKGHVPDDDTIESDIAAVLSSYEKYIEQKTRSQETARYWLFQANPKYYDLTRAVNTLKEETWSVARYKDEVRKGDQVYLWESGANAGIVAKGTIASDPGEMPQREVEKQFVRGESRFEDTETRVLIQIDRVLKQRLTRSDCLQDEVLKSLAVIKFANATNFKVTAEEAARIEELINMPDNVIDNTETPIAQLQKLTFFGAGKIQEIDDLVSSKKQLIFEGPPGSGKTYVAGLFARYFAGLPLLDGPSPQVRIVQFHQSYGYEDFIEGIRPQSNGGQIEYNVVPGIFKRLCSDARANEEQKFVIIIDEINRGNISRIFGELLLLLEYRELGVELPYQKDGQLFSIPPNVFVIGTMNTTDRSLAQIDYALRRRFYFYRLMPVVAGRAPVLEGWLAAQTDFTPTERQEVLTLFLNLNARIRQELGEHFQVGHSYFMKPEIRTGAGRKRIWDYAVMPLMEEYFYNRRDRDSLLTEFAIQSLLQTTTQSAGA